MLLGDSLIRDINPEALTNVDVKCMRGAQTDDMCQFLNETGRSYNQVILVAGTNNCSTDSTPEEVVTKVDHIVKVAKQFSKEPVLLSSICPRTDNSSYQDKVESVNAVLSSIETPYLKFVNNDQTFRLQDGSINDGYLHADGLHLSSSGSERLARNLNIGSYADIVIKRSYSKPRQTNNHKHNNNQKSQMASSHGKRHQSSGSRHSTSYKPVAALSHHGKQNTSAWPRPSTRHGHTRADANLNLPRDSYYCSFCGEQSHTTDLCFHGKRVTCRACGELGHKEKMCWNC